MERSCYKAPGMIRISGNEPDIPKFRSIADERLSRSLKQAVNRESAPVALEASVRAIFDVSSERA